MAIYSCNLSSVSRAKGSSAVGSAAYITCRKMTDERTGDICNFGNKSGFVLSETLLPEGAPEEFKDPEVMFNSIEMLETAANAKTAKKVMVALPREMDLYIQQDVVRSFIRENFTDKGYAATYAIHDKGDGNPHAHIIVPTRQIEKDGSWAKVKERKEYALDANGNRIPQLDANGNQKLGKRNEKLWKRVRVQTNEIETREFLLATRKSWADQCNRYLGKEHQIDHRSLADQGIDRIPTIHEGYAAREIEARGGVSDRMQENRDIRERNSLIERLKESIRARLEDLKDLFGIRDKEEREKAAEERRRAEKERQKEKSNFEVLKDIAKAEIAKSDVERLLHPAELTFTFTERKKELLSRQSSMLMDQILGGGDLPKEYHEISAELEGYEKSEKKFYKQLEIVEDGLKRGYEGERLFDYTQERMEAEEQQMYDRTSPEQEHDLDMDDEEWER